MKSVPVDRTGSLFGNPYLLLSLATLLWGGNAVAGKLAIGDWGPFTLTSARWFCAVLVLLPFALAPLKRDAAVVRRHLPLLFALGALGMCAFNLLMYLALNFTSAINVSIEQASMPILIMIANFIVFSQRVRSLQIVGLVLSIAGVAITVTGGEPWRFFSGGLNAGDAWMLLACAFYAAYTFGLRWRPDIHWMSFMLVVACSAFLMTIPFALFEQTRQPFTMPGVSGWLVLVYVVIFPTVVSQIAYARGVELIGGNRAGLFINLVPVFGSLLAVLLLGERFEWFHGLGLALVIGGISLAERAADKAVIERSAVKRPSA